MKVKSTKHIHLLKLSLLLGFALIIGFITTALAQTEEPLKAEQAFKLISISLENKKNLVSKWDVAEHYYLYESKFNFEVTNNEAVKLGIPQFPKTTIYKYFPTGERMRAHSGHFSIKLPFTLTKKITTPVKIKISFQGCSTIGLCYPKQVVTKTLSFTGINPITHTKHHVLQKTPKAQLTHTTHKTPPAKEKTNKEQGKLVNILRAQSLGAIILAFFIAGSLLSLTPCVLPMIPILSSIIVGQKKITHLHSFMLSLTYVLAMAITYAILGLLVGLAGAHIQAALQTPWVIILFTVIFVLMALSLFGFYNLELPQSFRHKVAEISNHQKHGTYIGTAIMGVLATLILSPCVTPALAGAIIYIGDKGDALLGAIALFVMGIGMGIPLLALGAFGPKILPKPGYWMNLIKYFFGVILLGVAIYMISRIIPSSAAMVLWGLLGVGCAIAMGAFHSVKGAFAHIIKVLGILVFIWGILILTGSIIGSTDPLQPITFTRIKTNPIHFKRIKTVANLKQAFQLAKHSNKPVLLDFYASWCADCRVMDETTFKNPHVKQLAKQFIFLRANVSNNDAKDKALQTQFKVIAPPTILFFTPNGHEIKNSRLVGSTTSAQLVTQLRKILHKIN